MKIARLKKYPRCSGSRRFAAYFVSVEVLDSEIRTEGRIRGDGSPRFTIEVRYFRIREKNKRSVWVPERLLFDIMTEADRKRLQVRKETKELFTP